MFGFLGDPAETTTYDLIYDSISKFGDAVSGNFLLYATIIFIVALVLVTVLRAIFSYESRMLKSVIKLNSFFARNQYVNEENLVELNNKFKKVPNTLRHCWQDYMLNRDGLPGDYINSKTCLEKSEKVSGYDNAIQTCKTMTIIMAALLTFFAVTRANSLFTNAQVIRAILEIVLMPTFILIVGYVLVVVMQLRYNAISLDLYTEFDLFVRMLNKACSTMPNYVDYEVLFTPREIKEGIPILQDYLEKRAFEEQQAAEAEKMKVDNFEQFDFNELGIENAILLDRAMLECEKYFNAKRTLNEQSSAKQDAMYKTEKAFDEVEKEFERKAQTLRENIAQAVESMNNTNVQIEINYQRRLQQESQKKLQQLEKDHEFDTEKFKRQQTELENEIKSIDNEITSRKNNIEEVMKSEGKNYANKVYGLLNKMISAQKEPYLKQLEDQKNDLQNQVDDLNKTITTQTTEIDIKKEQIDGLERDLRLKLAQIEAIGNVKEYFGSKEFHERVIDAKRNYRKNIEDQIPDTFQSTENLKLKLATAEEQLKIANEKQEELKVREQELLAKLNQSGAKTGGNSEPKPDKLPTLDLSKPDDNLNDIQSNIDSENAKYLKKQEELEQTVNSIDDNSKKPISDEIVPNEEIKKEEVKFTIDQGSEIKDKKSAMSDLLAKAKIDKK